MTMADRFYPSDRLRSCKLWKGSTLQLADKYQNLDWAMVTKRRDALRRCDDRTPEENELLAALEWELDGQWE